MAHEVIKRVGRRAYRYRVESYRDRATQKVRSRWTYLGVADTLAERPAGAEPRAPRRDAALTREALIDAFERLTEQLPYAAVTAGAVAAEAGLAHGTFYRYFKDKRAVFVAALERVRAEFDRAMPSFQAPCGTLAEERARVRAWVDALLLKPAEHPGVLHAFFEVLENDEELRTERSARRRERVAAFSAYLEGLAETGIIASVAAEELAAVLLVMVDAVFRAAAVERVTVDPMLAAGAVDVFDRAIFQECALDGIVVSATALSTGICSATRVASAGGSTTPSRPDSKVQ